MKHAVVGMCCMVLCAGVADVALAKDAKAKGAAPAEAVMPAQEQAQEPAVALLTIENLAAAYSGELSAKEKYMAYAQKADQEGYKKVAQLFRGAAKSEEIHAGIYTKALSSLGVTPQPVLQPVTVKSTKENIEDALSGETYESESLYPKFLEQAQKDKVEIAAIGFGSAMKIEVNHKTYFSDALQNMKKWKRSSKTGFYVCKICGNLEANLTFTTCVICNAPKEEFLQVL